MELGNQCLTPIKGIGRVLFMGDKEVIASGRYIRGVLIGRTERFARVNQHSHTIEPGEQKEVHHVTQLGATLYCSYGDV